ncbi:MAG: ParB N-terminal domain-containing protein [Candidatus Kapabacteria bacterium]|nr:ParB N-terminal domain-containing protein [Ignavibacteriota bacterium]MCW5886400.1 ParB N-terminal domain-containing protein [Candidatus Kapabacteria bacterium]
MNQTQTIKLDELEISKKFQSRAAISQDVIDEYAYALRLGTELPPMTVFLDSAKYYLVDGYHRYYAHKKAGNTAAVCEVHYGTERDAILYAAGANAKHGLNRTNEDKRKAVMTLLNDTDWAQWSNYKIATHCSVSEGYVRLLRDAIIGDTSYIRSMKSETGEDIQSDTTYIRSMRSEDQEEKEDINSLGLRRFTHSEASKNLTAFASGWQDPDDGPEPRKRVYIHPKTGRQTMMDVSNIGKKKKKEKKPYEVGHEGYEPQEIVRSVPVLVPNRIEQEDEDPEPISHKNPYLAYSYNTYDNVRILNIKKEVPPIDYAKAANMQFSEHDHYRILHDMTRKELEIFSFDPESEFSEVTEVPGKFRLSPATMKKIEELGFNYDEYIKACVPPSRFDKILIVFKETAPSYRHKPDNDAEILKPYFIKEVLPDCNLDDEYRDQLVGTKYFNSTVFLNHIAALETPTKIERCIAEIRHGGVRHIWEFHHMPSTFDAIDRDDPDGYRLGDMNYKKDKEVERFLREMLARFDFIRERTRNARIHQILNLFETHLELIIP